MRIRLVLTSLWVIVLWVPATALAQTTAAQTGVEPGGTAKPWDKIFVTDRNGVQIGGRLLRRSPQALTLLVAGTEREILSSAVGRIEKRDSLWNGMLIGAVPFAVLGAGGAGASCSPDCGSAVPQAMLVVGGIGAGLGALVDAGIGGYSTVEGPPLASRNALRVPAPVTRPEDLWLRVRQGDAIEVATLSGQKVTRSWAWWFSGRWVSCPAATTPWPAP